LGISGNVSGDAVTGLILNPNQPNSANTPDTFTYRGGEYLFTYDNVVYNSAPSVDVSGILFKKDSGTEYNLYSDSATQYELASAKGGVGANSIGTLSSATPEPAAWALMIVGMGAVGAMLRRQRLVPLAV
jgi:hypothetical protein